MDYKDDATAFNGLKKGTILGKGVINNQMTNRLMAKMEKAGIPTHFVEELSERDTLVKKVSIVPLEVIIRNVSAGHFAQRYGVEEGIVFDEPTIGLHPLDVRTLLGRISRDAATGKRFSEDPGGSGYSRFLNIATAIGLLFLGVAAVKYGDTLMPGRLAASIPQGAALIFSLLVSLASLGVAAYQTIAVRLAGALTLSQPFIAQLMLLKRTCFALGMILISPPLLLFALCPQGTGGVWFCIIAVELAAAAVLYLKETLNLFLSKKVSILHWFLYLCIVEVFPVSLLWLLAVR